MKWYKPDKSFQAKPGMIVKFIKTNYDDYFKDETKPGVEVEQIEIVGNYRPDNTQDDTHIGNGGCGFFENTYQVTWWRWASDEMEIRYGEGGKP